MLPQKFSAATTSTFPLEFAPPVRPQAAVSTAKLATIRVSAPDFRRPGTRSVIRLLPHLTPQAATRACSFRSISVAQVQCASGLRKSKLSGRLTLMPRPSPVRDALREIFATRDHQTWSLDELRDRVHAMIGAGDYSTIFRAANVLETKGLVQRGDLGGGLSRYQAR